MQVAVMPKTYRERLTELGMGSSILIDKATRQVWANNVLAVNRDTDCQYTIRTEPGTNEIRVWRLK
jgi:hypothetical protein